MYEKLTVTAIRTETRNTKTFFLNGESPFRYTSGQFLTLVFPKESGEARRNYSLCTSPSTDPHPAITVKRIDNGEFSRLLFDHTRVGDSLFSLGAFGYFTLPHPLPAQIVFLAAGSGITPVFSLIKTLLNDHPAQEITLIYSNHSPEETIFYDELRVLAALHSDRFVVEFLFSSSKNLLHARLGKWLLEKMIVQYVRNRKETLFYLCGPFDYMRMSTVVLLAEGIPDEHIRRENFVVHKPVIKELPPDTNIHTVAISINGTKHLTQVQFPKTILQQAKENNIPIPYSCESGQCGTCAATCVSGKVWMQYNEVLTEKEISQGRVLTCTGYPIGGDIVLTL